MRSRLRTNSTGTRAVAARSSSTCRRASAEGVRPTAAVSGPPAAASRAPLHDAAIDDLRALLVRDPERGVLLGAQVVDGLALLLDPGEVLLVVPAPAHLARALQDPVRLLAAEDGEPPPGLVAVHGALLAVQALQHGRVAVEAVGGHRDHGLLRAQAVVARGLDGGQHVAHAADAEGVDPARGQLRVHALG